MSDLAKIEDGAQRTLNCESAISFPFRSRFFPYFPLPASLLFRLHVARENRGGTASRLVHLNYARQDEQFPIVPLDYRLVNAAEPRPREKERNCLGSASHSLQCHVFSKTLCTYDPHVRV
jgi:hypothetical protein